MEMLPRFLKNKRELALDYAKFFSSAGIDFFLEKENSISNYWLNCIFLKDRNERDEFLKFTNSNGVMTRPAWTLMNKLPMYKNGQHGNLENAQWIEDRLVNIPSSVRLNKS
jgi:perosamine synthetase